jgi:hypothetical protein
MSAAIFVVLALGWAGYLIPRALKHHDEAVKTRSIDRFSHTMRVLARRDPVSTRDTRLVVSPQRGPDNPRVVVPTDRPSRARLQAQRKAAASAARRRRRILIVLLLADIVVGVLAGLDILLLWSVAIPAGLTLAYLVLCRVLVRREHSAWDGRARRSAPPIEEEPAEEYVEEPAVRLRTSEGVEDFSADEDTAAISVSALAAAVPTTDGGSLWDPLPVTLPTYVGKPKAARTVRTIDLTDPSISSSGRDAADSQLVAEAEVAEAAERESPEQRAVNS